MAGSARPPRSRNIGAIDSALVRPLGHRNAELATILDEYLTRYSNPKSRYDARQRLTHLFRTTGARQPAELTTSDLFGWVTGNGRTLANNTVRQRLSAARTFCQWALRAGLVSTDPTQELDVLRKQYPKLYGKQQGQHPARFLTYDEAYGRLIPACSDGTWIGSRDNLAIRLGLLGIRSAEVINLRIGSLTPDQRLSWIGKGRRSRDMTPGATLYDLIGRWCRKYEHQLGRPLAADDPLLCKELPGAARHGGPRRLAWGRPMAQRTYFDIVTGRAAAAGLGHVAPHDLRRSAASILHNTRTADGAHVFDLLDIQRVLDHADPATTMRSYIEQVDHKVKDRAGAVLD